MKVSDSGLKGFLEEDWAKCPAGQTLSEPLWGQEQQKLRGAGGPVGPDRQALREAFWVPGQSHCALRFQSPARLLCCPRPLKLVQRLHSWLFYLSLHLQTELTAVCL